MNNFRRRVGGGGDDGRIPLYNNGQYSSGTNGYYYVDLDLPSGKLWCTKDWGNFDKSETITTAANKFEGNTYMYPNNFRMQYQIGSISEELRGFHYAATSADYKELFDNTDIISYYNTYSGNGYWKLTSKQNPNKYICLPYGYKWTRSSYDPWNEYPDCDQYAVNISRYAGSIEQQGTSSSFPVRFVFDPNNKDFADPKDITTAYYSYTEMPNYYRGTLQIEDYYEVE